MSGYINGKKAKELHLNGKKIAEAYINGKKVYSNGPSFYCYSSRAGEMFLGYSYTKNIVESIGEVVTYFKSDGSLATNPSELTGTSTVSANEIISNGFVFRGDWVTTYYYRYPDGDL